MAGFRTGELIQINRRPFPWNDAPRVVAKQHVHVARAPERGVATQSAALQGKPALAAPRHFSALLIWAMLGSIMTINASPVSFAEGGGSGPCLGCLVRAHGVCDCLDATDLKIAADLSRRVVYPAGAALALEGLGAPQVHNVRSGVARLARSMPDGRRQIIGFALPGDFIGLSAANPPGCAIEAVTDMTACVFSKHAFEAMAMQRPHLLLRLHHLAGTELHAVQDQLLLLGRRTASEKLASFLLHMHRRWRRIAATDAESQFVPLPMGRRDIADYLGLTVETVSRTFTRFARSSLVGLVPNGAHLLAADDLQRLASGGSPRASGHGADT